MGDGGSRDPDLEGDVVQREEAEERSAEVLTRVRSKDEDLVGWSKIGDIVLTDVVSKLFKAAMIASVNPKHTTESGSSTRSAKPR